MTDATAAQIETNARFHALVRGRGEADGWTSTRPIATSHAARSILGSDYLDVTDAARDHDFAGLHVGLTSRTWDIVTSHGTAPLDELNTRFGMLLAAVRIAAIDAMTSDGTATTFAYQEAQGAPERVELTVRYLPCDATAAEDRPQLLLVNNSNGRGIFRLPAATQRTVADTVDSGLRSETTTGAVPDTRSSPTRSMPRWLRTSSLGIVEIAIMDR